jgi:ferric-dicitrate binding protein FerR (iron transport regulator)
MNDIDPPDRRDADPGDGIEALLRRTGSRPAVPTDRAARVAAAAKAHWRGEMRRAARRRWAWGALPVAAVLGAIAVGLGLLGRRGPDAGGVANVGPAARIEMVSEAAWLQIAGRDSPARMRVGDSLVAGAEIATEQRGRVALRLSTGHSVRLDTGTRLRIVDARAIALERGAIYVDSRTLEGDGPTGPIEIRTPLGTIRDTGTQFEVRWLPAALRVRVREGRIAFDTSHMVVDVAAGQEVESRQDLANAPDALVRRVVPAVGAALDWIDGITPMPDIYGRSLQSFLGWMARERGLRLAFATPETAAAARRIVLTGSIAGMTPDQALDSVLATCRMSYRIEGQVLRVEPSSSEHPETP